MTLELNQVTTIFLAIALLVLGMVLTRKVGFLRKFCIPAPVVGGLLFALFATMFKSLGWLNLHLIRRCKDYLCLHSSRQSV